MEREAAIKPSKHGDRVLVLGVGNTLLSDDGFGVHVAERLRSEFHLGDNVIIRDGGTIGLSLLPDIEDSDRLIVIDAGEIKASPGDMQIYFDAEMDDHLSRCKGTVHEVAVNDLLAAARLTGRSPRVRALVVVQPQSVTWGEHPTDPVTAAIPKACETIASLVEEWRQ